MSRKENKNGTSKEILLKHKRTELKCIKPKGLDKLFRVFA